MVTQKGTLGDARGFCCFFEWFSLFSVGEPEVLLGRIQFGVHIRHPDGDGQ